MFLDSFLKNKLYFLEWDQQIHGNIAEFQWNIKEIESKIEKNQRNKLKSEEIQKKNEKWRKPMENYEPWRKSPKTSET
jgi:tRNA A37 threonylcarbamoyladenosine biosynthesis protein TsaE